ncbi:MAG: hypothetical protein MR868_07855 [Lachnospiraceae bacterium]|nr:hypothetical protein [Lachnospiraceae bacterium]
MDPEKDWRTLGMIGAGRGTGVTHLSVWTANYLTGVHRERTAVLEWNRHGDFAEMRRFCGAQLCGAGLKSCRILDAEYFPDAGSEELAFCMNEDYRRIIVDYGEISGENILECARCDRKVIVGALSEWQAEAFLEEVKRAAERDRSWRYAAAFGSEETRKQLEKTFRVSCLRIPASVDAFAVTRADMNFFTELLKEK